MIKHLYTQLSCILMALFCMSVLSCSKNPITVDPEQDNYVTFKANVFKSDSYDVTPLSRAGENIVGKPEEEKIKTIKFLIYKSDNTLEAYSSAIIAENGASSDLSWNPEAKSVRMVLTPGAKKVYCIANWADNATAEMPLIDRTTTINDLNAILRTHTDVTPTNPAVMTGVTNCTVVEGGTKFSIDLIRQISRVDLRVKLSDDLVSFGAKVRIIGVRFNNLGNSAYLFPRTSVASLSGAWAQTNFRGVDSPDFLSGSLVDYGVNYYIPEYKATNIGSATEMILKAKYNGQVAHYMIPIDPSKSNDSPSHNQFTIERNHIYRYNITINGMGSPSDLTRGIYQEMVSSNITYNLEIK